LKEYRTLAEIDRLFSAPEPLSDYQRVKTVRGLISFLQEELPKNHNLASYEIENSSYNEIREVLYSLLIIRQPNPLPTWFHSNMDRLLQLENLERTIVDAETIPRIKNMYPKISYPISDQLALWKGDITSLKIDAIVNAANKTLLGCFQPFHKCIDNAIHSKAGPRLREVCNEIMSLQGCSEEPGWAKITLGYNLPSKYVLHTVGPKIDLKIANNNISKEQQNVLASCYISCLDLALKIPAIQSIAFCSVSTGVFGFPIELAAKIALSTTIEWMENHSDAFDLIVFDVYSQKDYEIYEKLLKGGIK
jgi:O-acetyl-ADP-ribose deacetylase (regulator of RNase III)